MRVTSTMHIQSTLAYAPEPMRCGKPVRARAPLPSLTAPCRPLPPPPLPFPLGPAPTSMHSGPSSSAAGGASFALLPGRAARPPAPRRARPRGRGRRCSHRLRRSAWRCVVAARWHACCTRTCLPDGRPSYTAARPRLPSQATAARAIAAKASALFMRIRHYMHI